MTTPVTQLKAAGEIDKQTLLDCLDAIRKQIECEDCPRVRSIVAVVTDEHMTHSIHDAGNITLGEQLGQLLLAQDTIVLKARKATDA